MARETIQQPAQKTRSDEPAGRIWLEPGENAIACIKNMTKLALGEHECNLIWTQTELLFTTQCEPTQTPTPTETMKVIMRISTSCFHRPSSVLWSSPLHFCPPSPLPLPSPFPSFPSSPLLFFSPSLSLLPPLLLPPLSPPTLLKTRTPTWLYQNLGVQQAEHHGGHVDGKSPPQGE